MLTGNIVLLSIYRSAIECSISDFTLCGEKKQNCSEVKYDTISPTTDPVQATGWQAASVWTNYPMTIYLPLLFTKERQR